MRVFSMKNQLSIKVKTPKLSTAGCILPLVAAILFIFSAAEVHGWDPFKIGKASKHVHLEKVKEVGDEGLINATLERIKETYEDCFEHE